MPAWAIWVVIAAALAAGEIATPGLFFLGPVAFAAAASFVVAALGVGLVGQLAVFAGGSALALLVLRPLARRTLRLPPALRSGAAALRGARATVIQPVMADAGTVSIGGDIWSARPYVEGDVIDQGVTVEVVEIDGATARVMR